MKRRRNDIEKTRLAIWCWEKLGLTLAQYDAAMREIRKSNRKEAK